MKTTWILTPLDESTLSWRGESVPSGSGSVADLAALPEARQADLVLEVPAQKMSLQQVAFAASERRLLRQTVPYALEEQMLDDVETQHFALGPVADGQVPVAVVAQQWLTDWLAQCAQAGLEVKHALPEILQLPWQPGCWSLAPRKDYWLVRVDRWRGFALDIDNAALALQILLDEAEQLPTTLHIYDDTQPLVDWQSQLPELLRGICVLATLPALSTAPESTLDFLQGAFARRLPWLRWWMLWQLPVVVGVIAVAVQLGVSGMQHHQLQKENVALRQQVEQIYRSVEPSGAVVEPERQLRRKVEALRVGQGSAVMPLLQRLGGAIKSIDGISIQTLGYSEKQHELRLSVVAGSFKDVEALRAAIAATGLDAQLAGTNADGEKTRAQMRISEPH